MIRHTLTALAIASLFAAGAASAAMPAAEKAPLGKGEVSVFTFADGVKIHNWNTGDALGDNLAAVETKTGVFAIESAAFRPDFPVWGEYLRKLGKPLTAAILSNHPNNADAWAGGAPVLVADASWKAMQSGGIKGIMTGLEQAFGKDFDVTLPAAPQTLNLGDNVFEGVKVTVTQDGDGTELVLPAQKTAYIHMMGSTCHSIIAGAAHADYQIAQLERLQKAGIELVLTGHWVPEGADAMAAKIAYLKDIKAIAAASRDKAAFVAAVKAKYPKYVGDNYLDMTAGFFFPAK
ncbi:hypothetical protein [Sutterella sp.]|uniref:hypothetical protein n=1 Tax=Sutterella sp. TaxID=1981025 RepID=UPI0026DF155B|nr:hypothetical protein [Sutterella sp.]MDO5532284.1 hypothetical protein [Sutterella sp.]